MYLRNKYNLYRCRNIYSRAYALYLLKLLAAERCEIVSGDANHSAQRDKEYIGAI